MIVQPQIVTKPEHRTSIIHSSLPQVAVSRAILILLYSVIPATESAFREIPRFWGTPP